MFGDHVWPEDFYTHQRGQKVRERRGGSGICVMSLHGNRCTCHGPCLTVLKAVLLVGYGITIVMLTVTIPCVIGMEGIVPMPVVLDLNPTAASHTLQVRACESV